MVCFWIAIFIAPIADKRIMTKCLKYNEIWVVCFPPKTFWMITPHLNEDVGFAPSAFSSHCNERWEYLYLRLCMLLLLSPLSLGYCQPHQYWFAMYTWLFLKTAAWLCSATLPIPPLSSVAPTFTGSQRSFCN